MKNVIISTVVSIVVTVFVTVFAMKSLNQGSNTNHDLEQLTTADAAVKKQLQLIESNIVSQLSAFADAVEADRIFSLKFFFENDKSSPEVVDIAGLYMKAMGFTALKVVDSKSAIISSGHFPASAGIDVSAQVHSILLNPVLVYENIMDRHVLTIQAKKDFRIADSLFYAVGGIEINQSFFDKLAPWDKVKVFMKHGADYIGMDNIKSISEIKDNKIIINDKEYFATSIPIVSANRGNESFLIVVVEK